MPAGGGEAVGAADDEMPDAVGEDPGGDHVQGGALGAGPRPVRLSAMRESPAQGVEQVVDEGGGCSDGRTGVDAHTSQDQVVCCMRGDRPAGVVVLADEDSDGREDTACTTCRRSC